MNYREQIAARFSVQLSAKPIAGPTLEEAKKINEHRLNQKRTTLAARISKLVYSLDEHQVDEWAAQMDAADKVRLSARVRGIHAGIKSSLLIQGA